MKRTPLGRKTPLRAHTRLERTGRLARSSRLRARPKPMGDAELQARMLVTARSRGRCELNLPTVCTGRAVDWSHRIARGRGGKWTASDGLAACRACHEAITNTRGQRARFERWGFICRTNAVTTEVPVLLGCRRWVLLDDQGGVTDIDDIPRGNTHVD